jgi:hypothetical protein
VADRTYLAGLHQVGQCGEGLLDVGAGLGVVDLVEVDVGDTEASQ